uniref:NADH-ubiquinone oxidoreductase chain 6 n=1 Tax=Dicyphus sp. TaxID=2931289 RepID=A0A8T9ZXY2_9HEMI|nr:NADH dehydrogenase subunit 6 [Dicyphus sp.]
MIIMLMLMMNTIIMYMKHPMSMGLTLIIQTAIISLMSGMLMKTFWMSYILLITMLSGMLVLFVYMSSVASNEKFNHSFKMTIFMTLILLMSIPMYIMESNLTILYNANHSENMKISNMNMYMMMKMFNGEYVFITLMMIIYLLLTMIMSTNIVKVDQGPMRMKT